MKPIVSRKYSITPISNSPLKVPRPFVKWVGGKKQLLDELHRRLPTGFRSYHEPFVGGGALLWSINREVVEQITINDSNPELINCYRVIRDDLSTLVKRLKKFKHTDHGYYEVRGMDRKPSWSRVQPTTKAARILFLNKTGFNGLYRVNSKGQNNVPFGSYDNPTILDEPNLVACSNFLQGVKITCGDFENRSRGLNANSFVYLDPPYAPLSPTSSFTGYTPSGFNQEAQIRLKKYCDYLHSQGCKFMLSNSSAPLIYELYSEYQIDEVLARRAVNCNGNDRGYVKELIIRNYAN